MNKSEWNCLCEVHNKAQEFGLTLSFNEVHICTMYMLHDTAKEKTPGGIYRHTLSPETAIFTSSSLLEILAFLKGMVYHRVRYMVPTISQAEPRPEVNHSGK